MKLAFKITLLLFLMAPEEDKKTKKRQKGEKYGKKGKEISGGKEE